MLIVWAPFKSLLCLVLVLLGLLHGITVRRRELRSGYLFILADRFGFALDDAAATIDVLTGILFDYRSIGCSLELCLLFRCLRVSQIFRYLKILPTSGSRKSRTKRNKLTH